MKLSRIIALVTVATACAAEVAPSASGAYKGPKVERFRRCDPSSDRTLIWRYWSIRTGLHARPRIYGWMPANCPRSLR